MKVFRFFLIYSLNVLLCFPIFAQAPTTAKIAFVSRGRTYAILIEIEGF